ncbi:lipoyl domain-containing protein [Streptomyces alanosinicus]|uniref:Lipoyl-binding domain-containing protein n=1 Tax=Streptomyces alanosinicus TaxID=68171 RepID=A0A919D4T4_9ACTN|nr:lipoyl domain-containing protein [Streptomyces alanosinicus]GHE08494.1 hypothetical protein GCM10010339_57290 [Streptomyces alanosinicus]
MRVTARGRIPRIVGKSFLIAALAAAPSLASASLTQASASTSAPQGQTRESRPTPSPSAKSHTTKVVMPNLGQSVTEAIVTRWLAKVGESVQAGQPLLEVSTDKVDAVIDSPASGKLTKIVVKEDRTAKVGATIALISSGSSASRTRSTR